MDTRFLLTFQKILETGSFLAAANALGYTQSTVTFHIRQLEQEFNLKLFEKIGRRMILTQAGKDILPHVESILQYTARIEDYSKDADSLTGDLKVALPETLLVYQIQPVLKKFRTLAPDINLSLQSYNCYTISSYILNGMIDVGIYYDVSDRNPSYVEEELGDFCLDLIAPPEFPNTCTAEILAQHSLIISNDYENVCRNRILPLLTAQGITPKNILELSSFEAIKRSVSNNMGYSYVPEFIVTEELANGSIQKLQLGFPEERIPILCVHHKNKWISPAMRLFIDLTKEHMGTPDA